MPKNDKMVRLSSVLTLLTIFFKDDQRFLKALRSLKPQEEQVLRMRFGIGEKPDHTLEAVGPDFEATRDNIRRIEKEALWNVWKKTFLGEANGWLQAARICSYCHVSGPTALKGSYSLPNEPWPLYLL